MSIIVYLQRFFCRVIYFRWSTSAVKTEWMDRLAKQKNRRMTNNNTSVRRGNASMIRTETYYIVLKEPRKRGTGFRAASVLSAPDKLLNPLKILGKKTMCVQKRVALHKACRAIMQCAASMRSIYPAKKKENDTYVRVYRIYTYRLQVYR